ncbi:UNC93-like protein 2, partial [Mucuna pruriens]
MVSSGDEERGTETTTGSSFFRHNSPLVQVILIGLICFCCPGMFNALSGMGGGGQLDHTASNNSLTALYIAFSISGILGGAIYNLLGPHLTLLAGCSTYVLYTASLLYYNHRHSQALAIVAGAILGIGSGLVWVTQGAIMTSYPPANRKGTYISIFWSIFNMGGVIGGLIPFVSNFHRSEAASVNDGTYIGFMCFMSVGTVLSLAILPGHKVVGEDGSTCSNVVYSNMWTECMEIVKLILNWKVLLMVPAAWSSNFFYPYQFNDVNGVLFNLRTRGFNSVFYWGAQMLGSLGIGYVMDFSFKRRSLRGMLGVVVVGVLASLIWAAALVNQLRYSSNHLPQKLDFIHSGSRFAGPFLLYFAFGLLDAMFQTLLYWVIGALPHDSHNLARYSGFFKGIQSAGAAVAWQVDEHKVSFMSQLIVNWVLTTISYPLLFVLVMLSVKDQGQ